MKITIKLVLDAKSRQDRKKVFLRITFNRTARQYSLGLDYLLTQDEFDNTNLKRTKAIRAEAEPYLKRAESIINELGEDFTFNAFKELFRGAYKKEEMNKTVSSVYEHYISSHELSQGTQDSYRTVVNHLRHFQTNLCITDLNEDTIRKFQTFLKEKYREKWHKEMSGTSMAIYMRALRALYNYAEDKLGIDSKRNPFGRNRIRITSKTNVKKALNENDFQKLTTYHPQNKEEEFAHDMFCISYGLSGINLADLVGLKNENIYERQLSFIREKTKQRVNSTLPICLDVPEYVFNLMNKYGAISENPKAYIFPFLRDGMTEKQILRKRKEINKKINRGLKRICEKIGIEPITLYTARHTFATNLYNNDISINDISRLLGHTNPQTTTNYLGTLGLEHRKKIQDVIGRSLQGLHVGA